MDFVFKLAGQAGAGVMTVGRLMAKCFTRGGYNVIAYPEYPSLIRGGHNTVQVRISDNEISSPTSHNDLVIALNKDAVFYHMNAMSSGGMIIYDQLIDVSKFKVRSDVKMHPLPLAKLTQEAGGTEQMKNTAAVGAALAAVDYPFEFIEKIMRDEFGHKGEEVIAKNVKAARAGYDYVKSNNMRLNTIKPIAENKKNIIITGNEAIALGAIAAGLKFYSAYPMTPASTILHYLIDNESEFNLVVKQTEDEIAAMCYAIGASYAGARSMVGTSGGGFALMAEALGLAAISETPIVIALAQRSGPSTGMPTWTEQGDLRFALHASQGDFPRIILAPGDVQDCFHLTAKALNLAEKYQVPVFVLSDKNLSETTYSTKKFNQNKMTVERGKIATPADLPQLPPMTRWKRYTLAEDGVSPRVFPGTPNGMHVASSYEHDETGFSSESFVMRTKQVQKRAVKVKAILQEMEKPEKYGPAKADVTLVGWGSAKTWMLDALKTMEQRGIIANFVNFTHLYPLDPKVVKSALWGAKILVMVENNSTAQFAGLLREIAGVEMDFHLLKYDGRPFYPDQIADEIGKLKQNGYKTTDGQKEIVVVEKDDLEYYQPQRHGL